MRSRAPAAMPAHTGCNLILMGIPPVEGHANMPAHESLCRGRGSTIGSGPHVCLRPRRLALPCRFRLLLLTLEALFQRIHQVDDVTGLRFLVLRYLDLLALGFFFDELAQLLGIGVLEPLGIEWP